MGYRWDAGGYDRNASFQRGLAAELIGKLRLNGGERVLDVGCGDGKNTAEIAKLVPEGSVLGIDSSPEMIAFASKNHDMPNLGFEVRDVLELGHDSEFDVIFSNAALHWVKDHQRMLKNVSAALRPGGRILLQMGGKGNAQDMFRVLDAMRDSGRWGEYFTGYESPFGFYGPEEYGPWLKDAGFTAVRVELVHKDMAQDWPDGFKGWIRSTWLPYTQSVPETLREEYIDEAAGEYLKAHPRDKDGKIHAKMVRLEVEAERGVR